MKEKKREKLIIDGTVWKTIITWSFVGLIISSGKTS